MAARELLSQHRRDLDELVRIANKDLDLYFRQFDSIEAARAALMDVLPQLITIYGSAAIALGADWYDEVREAAGARGRFRAVPGDLHDPGSAYSLAGWAANEAQDVTSMKSLVAGGVQKRIADMDRHSVRRSATADPQSAGWKRIGAGECDFCRILIERDQLYREDTADFASHTNCKCQAYPLIKGAEPIDVKDYVKSSRYIEDDEARAAAQAKVHEWIAEHPNA